MKALAVMALLCLALLATAPASAGSDPICTIEYDGYVLPGRPGFIDKPDKVTCDIPDLPILQTQ